MEREIRYCTTEDGVRIAYCVEGEGPALVVLPEFLDSFGFEHLVPEFQRFRRRVGEGRQLLMYDRRGLGLSQRDVTYSFEADVNDLRTVIRASGLDNYSLFATGVAGPSSIAYAATNPPGLRRLALYGTFASTPATESMGGGAEGLVELMQSNWQLASQVIADFTQRDQSREFNLGLARMYREASSGEQAARWVIHTFRLMDVRAQLASVRVPTLIMHRVNDPLWPLQNAQQLAAAIPDARLVTIEGSHHPVYVGDVDPIITALNAFLEEDPETRRKSHATATREIPRGLRTVLFTDLVGHTEMMSRLGDERGREVLREHERITREVLKAHAGTEVKTMGDGFMASFGSVTKAVECAVALQRAIDVRNRGVGAQHTGQRDDISKKNDVTDFDDDPHVARAAPLRVRVGLNAGEPIEEDGDLFGATVILASRIAARAEGGEILVADTVRGLCSGKGFLFADRGEFVAKGFEEPVRVYEVRWRE
jgi:class 3 adenylate cyclase